MESYVEDRRWCECRIHALGKSPHTSDYSAFSDFVDGFPVIPPAGDRYFHIKTLLNERYYDVSELQHNSFPNLHPNGVATHANSVRYDFFNISEKSVKQAINYIFSILNVTEQHKYMARPILNYAKNLASRTHERRFYIILVVNVDIYYHKETSTKDSQSRASHFTNKSSNNELKGVKIQCLKDLRVNNTVQMHGSHPIETSTKDDRVCSNEACNLGVKLQQCAICCEDLRVDAVQTPCSHLFHGNCIVNWLLEDNSCPICSFEISACK